jgi:hypothetical protein
MRSLLNFARRTYGGKARHYRPAAGSRAIDGLVSLPRGLFRQRIDALVHGISAVTLHQLAGHTVTANLD